MFKQNLKNCVKLFIRRSPFARLLRRFFRRKSYEEALLLGKKRGWSTAADWILFKEGRCLLGDTTFHEALRKDINSDIRTEFLLSAMRKKLLFHDLTGHIDSYLLETIVSLVIQAQNNEFVWQVSEEEKSRLNDIITNLSKYEAAENKWAYPVLLLMYGRPGQAGTLAYEQHSKLLENSGEMPKELNGVIKSCITDYKEEQSLKENIEKHGEIKNETSKVISSMYENYPYPRWLTWGFSKPGTRIKKLARFFTEEETAFTNKEFNILVAGCGTGSKAIEYAISYGSNAKVVAVDLSRASLAYAKRMAIKSGVNNIEFIQMDLLQLPSLEQEFDIVECTGVLHHMADPLEGGRAIISRVREGGLVHISLYSELARKSIIELRNKYNLTSDMSNDEMRSMRVKIMQNDADTVNEKLSLRWDFFDLNRCKDLLFHPLEHRYTVPEIDSFLNGLNLEFRGFEKPGIVRSQYWTSYPKPTDMTNLKKWNEFELRHPDAFGNLYEIWAKQ